MNSQTDQLWVDLFAPESEEDLAVHKRKVEDVRRWLVDALDGGHRTLALNGPAGVGKTATIRVLAKELGVELVEWRNGMEMTSRATVRTPTATRNYESLSLKFQTFLERASSYHTLPFTSTQISSSFSLSSSEPKSTPTGKVSPMPPPPPATSPRQGGRRQLILVEDLPNIIHQSTRESFHVTLTSFANAAETPEWASVDPPTDVHLVHGPPILISSLTISNAVAADEDDTGEQAQQGVSAGEEEEEVKALAEARARALEAAEKGKARARKGWLADDDTDSE
ncbi:Cell cycle checkpoint protein rad17 [Tulasnella sp. 425]|nr:Cell cycle checkpoint protein rad17 [Tulasnella sp. 425]